MPRLIKKTSKKAGLSPGSLVHIGEKKIDEIKMTLINYDPEQLLEKALPIIEASFPYKDTPPVTWINVDGLHEVNVIEKIGVHFGIHPLVLEDIVNTGQRPKVEEFENYIYIVLKMLDIDTAVDHITAEQVSLIIGPHFLISFQEKEGDVFNYVRERIRKARGRIRNSGCDYLAYALMDAVVDHYFVILEKLGEKIEQLEEQLLEEPTPRILEEIHHLKREMIFFRKQVWPLREVINSLIKDPSELIQETTHIFLRDVYDHTIQVIDTIESFRDVLSGLSDLYLSTVSNRMNEVMKVLTIIATIFIPLTFIAGIYGMNFEFMPELKWHWAYPMLWVLLVVIFVLMVMWFKRRRWL
ncbi:MAG: magnesium/cobalt transporter CorA [Deltaproteobacteria bacterium]|jgi:magnesium transporter|nr:magnesium/cobalt transporter CorA [Deltaproteobacteria bacterium]